MNRPGSRRRRNGITRRAFTRAAAAAGVSAVAAMSLGPLRIARAAAPAPARPNIILFIADDMRYDAAGFAGNPVIQTPRLDALARQSMHFTHCFVTTPICCSARATLMTGMYALRHGVYDFGQSLRPEHLDGMFPVLMRAAGYHTGFVGKWHIGEVPDGRFDNWMGYAGQNAYLHREGHLTDIQTRQAISFLEQRPPGQPFLLIVSYKAAHWPLIPQSRHSALYRNTDIPRSPTDPSNPALAPVTLPRLVRAHARHMKKYEQMMFSNEQYHRYMRRYYQLLTGLDESVGAVLDALDRQGASDGTAVVFTSDNGHLCGEHGLVGKSLLYEESIRVPLLIRPAPNRAAGFRPQASSAFALNVDIAPTVLGLAGITPPPGMQGTDLLTKPSAVDARGRRGVYFESPRLHRHTVFSEAYRTDGFKYVHYFTVSESEECLYDLAADPGEMWDRAAVPSYAPQLAALRRAMLAERNRLSAA